MCIFVGDIGDNIQFVHNRTEIKVYRFEEPIINAINSSLTRTIEWEVGRYTYPDHPHNAESMLIDVLNRQLLILTKTEPETKVYQALLDLQNGTKQMLEDTGNLV